MFTKQLLVISIFCFAGLQIGTIHAGNDNSAVGKQEPAIQPQPPHSTFQPNTSTTTTSPPITSSKTTFAPNITTTTSAIPTTITTPTTTLTPTTNATTTTVTPTTSPNSTTTSATPTTSTASTTSKTTTTVPTTTPPSNGTTTQPPSTSANPVTTVAPNPTAEPSKDRRFDGPSFVGGIVLSLGIMAIAFVSWKFYKARSERNYHTL